MLPTEANHEGFLAVLCIKRLYIPSLERIINQSIFANCRIRVGKSSTGILRLGELFD